MHDDGIEALVIRPQPAIPLAGKTIACRRGADGVHWQWTLGDARIGRPIQRENFDFVPLLQVELRHLQQTLDWPAATAVHGTDTAEDAHEFKAASEVCAANRW